MTLSLLSHLLHPHPEVTKIELKEPLAGAVLISPWVSFDTNTDSFKRHESSDMLSENAVKRWTSQLLGELDCRKPFFQPLKVLRCSVLTISLRF